MKKFAIAAIAAITATVSFASVAEAGRRHYDDWNWGRHHHRHHHRHWDDYGYGRDYCSTVKIIKRDDWGNKVVKIIKRCG
jgi:hypothetical protein